MADWPHLRPQRTPTCRKGSRVECAHLVTQREVTVKNCVAAVPAMKVRKHKCLWRFLSWYKSKRWQEKVTSRNIWLTTDVSRCWCRQSLNLCINRYTANLANRRSKWPPRDALRKIYMALFNFRRIQAITAVPRMYLWFDKGQNLDEKIVFSCDWPCGSQTGQQRGTKGKF